MSRDRDLMRAHIDALFTHDADGRLLRSNEPNGALAPRFFLGRTAEGAALRLRHDVDEALRHELKTAAYDEIFSDHPVDSPIDATRYEEILARFAPVQSKSAGPAFCFPEELPSARETVAVTDANAHAPQLHLPEWIPDVRLSQPMVALLVDGDAVAVCCSVRRTDVAHEAGVETATAFRGRGYAAQVVAGWARAVRNMDRIPLYSTSWQNEASRAVARKLSLVLFGSDLHIT